MNLAKVINIVFLLTISQIILCQKPAGTWDKWEYLIGEWIGEGIGESGQNAGSFSFKTDLEGKILVRKNHNVSPATRNSLSSVHDDILIVYPDNSTGDQKAIYFDNEGNVINYRIKFSGNSIIMTSDVTANNPRFRLSYIPIDSKTVQITFGMSSPQDPEEFRLYLSGKSHKVR